MTIKVGSKKYRLTVRHVIEVRIADASIGFIRGEGRSKCRSSDTFNEWTGIRQAIYAALNDAMGGSGQREDRAAFWEQVLRKFGITGRKPLPGLKPAPTTGQLYVPPALHGILRALVEPEAFQPSMPAREYLEPLDKIDALLAAAGIDDGEPF